MRNEVKNEVRNEMMSDNRLEDAFDDGYNEAEGLIECKGLQMWGSTGEDYAWSVKFKGAELQAWIDGFDARIGEMESRYEY